MTLPVVPGLIGAAMPRPNHVALSTRLIAIFPSRLREGLGADSLSSRLGGFARNIFRSFLCFGPSTALQALRVNFRQSLKAGVLATGCAAFGLRSCLRRSTKGASCIKLTPHLGVRRKTTQNRHSACDSPLVSCQPKPARPGKRKGRKDCSCRPVLLLWLDY